MQNRQLLHNALEVAFNQRGAPHIEKVATEGSSTHKQRSVEFALYGKTKMGDLAGDALLNEYPVEKKGGRIWAKLVQWKLFCE